jgi:uncharacterized protein YlaN (UPF0358 family)
MKFKVKSKARIHKLEESIKIMEKRNSELSADLNKAIYRMEEDTIRKLIKIESEVKLKMNTNNVYDHVEYEWNQVKDQYDVKLGQLTEKFESEFSMLTNKFTSMKLSTEKRDKKIEYLSKEISLVERKQKEFAISFIEKIEKMMDEKLLKYKENTETSESIKTLTKRMSETEKKVERVDDEIKEFFKQPLAPSKVSVIGGDVITSVMQPTDSARFSHVELDDIRNRFKRLQYENNKSIAMMREEIKDTFESKMFELQWKFLKIGHPMSAQTNKESSPKKETKKDAKNQVSSEAINSIQSKIDHIQESIQNFKKRIEKKVDGLKTELDFSSLLKLIKEKVGEDLFRETTDKLAIEIKALKNTHNQSLNEIKRANDWIIRLSEATAEIESAIKNTPIAFHQGFTIKCLSWGKNKKAEEDDHNCYTRGNKKLAVVFN